MTNRKFNHLMGYKIYSDDVKKITIPKDRKKIINTINPHSYVEAKKDVVFKEALHHSDIILPDGSGIVLASKRVNGEKIDKIAGMDLHLHLLELLNAEHGRCFYMGSSNGTLEKIIERLSKEYPNVNAATYAPPYKEKFSKKESEEIVKAVNAHKPDVLFVGLTAPKQEKWVYKHHNLINASIICSIGAVFDFYAGTVKRPSQFWIDRHLEWLPRLVKEPKRLWKRNFVSTPLFLLDMTLYKLKIKK